jgi:hypothetical protein
MKTLIIFLLTLSSSILVAQKSVTWVGGTPGSETSWDEPRNWSDHHVPNEFSNVFIPDVSTSSFSNPTIKDGVIELNSLQIESTAKLTIQKMAKLIVYGDAAGFYANNFEINGSFIVLDDINEMETDIKMALLKN